MLLEGRVPGAAAFNSQARDGMMALRHDGIARQQVLGLASEMRLGV